MKVAPRPRQRTAAAPGPLRSGLNDLTGREWIRFTRSWFVASPPPRRAEERSHPGKFPERLAEEFIAFFTRRGMVVLDPFAGTGSTLVAACRLGRRAVGIELDRGFASVARRRIREAGAGFAGPARVVTGDARGLARIVRALGIPSVDFVLTSPPYWDMLSKGRGGVESVHRRRAASGLRTTYSSDPRDLGNLHDYDAFLAELGAILRSAGGLLAPGRYLVVVLQNLRDESGRIRRLAWDVAARLDGPELAFQGERIWCQDDKPLGIWGYPSTFVPNYHHHYCLVFRRAGTLAPRAVPGAATRRSARRRRGASPRPRRGAAGSPARR